MKPRQQKIVIQIVIFVVVVVVMSALGVWLDLGPVVLSP
jgi:hypothetical protein